VRNELQLDSWFTAFCQAAATLLLGGCCSIGAGSFMAARGTTVTTFPAVGVESDPQVSIASGVVGDSKVKAPSCSAPAQQPLAISNKQVAAAAAVTGDPDCSANGTPNGKYFNGSECNLFVLTSKFCTYDGDGRFKGESKEPSGFCLCFGTP
jgi:hypothetical protein